MSETSKQEIRLFYCYAREDKALRDELEIHLSALKRHYHLINWHDREILPGENWEQAIDNHLKNADLILLLISPHFMASDYCYGKEMTKAIEQHQAGTCRVIPILIRPVYWENTPFSSLQMLPTNARPIMSWLNRDDALYNVVREISKAIRALISTKENVNSQIHQTLSREIMPSANRTLDKLSDKKISIKGLDTERPQAQNIPEEQINILASDFSIDHHLKYTRSILFWRFYVSRALHLSLSLIAEDRPSTAIGLLLPLQPEEKHFPITSIEDISLLGESLGGWLGKSQSTNTFLTLVPSFEFPSDYRIHPLMVMEQNQIQEEQPLDHTHIIVHRDSNPLTLRPPVVDIIHRLLVPIYESMELTREAFRPGMRDELVSAPNLDNTALYPDMILNGLAEEMVRAGGLLDQKPRWRFCCILLPYDLALPIQNRTLVVRAQSQYSPHKIGITNIPPQMNSLSMRAYHSGQVCYRNSIVPDDSVIAFYDAEGTVKSAIAIPVGAESGEPIAVVYLVSVYESAFSQRADRLLLRLLARMVEEAVRTYQVRRQESERLGSILRVPDRVDEVVGAFYNENRFIHDLEEFLLAFKTDQTNQQHSTLPTASSSNRAYSGNQEAGPEQHVISLIGIDVDHLSAVALKYGDTAVRNLYREIGSRLNGELKPTFAKYPGCRFYRMYGDCFYVLLRNMHFEEVLNKAVLLKRSLDGTYRVNLLHSSVSQQPTPGTLQEVEIKVRLAVSWYDDETLAELFARYSDNVVVDSVREMIDSSIISELKKGMLAGGNKIRAWNPMIRAYENYEKLEL